MTIRIDEELIKKLKAIGRKEKNAQLSDSISAIASEKGSREDFTLAAKAALNQNDVPLFQLMAFDAVDAASPQSLEEYFALENEFRQYQVAWVEKSVIQTLEGIEKDPLPSKAINYQKATTDDFIKLSTLSPSLRRSTNAQKLIADSGMAIGDLVKEYHADNACTISAEKRHQLEFESATRMFQNGVALLNEYADTQRQFAGEVGKKVRNTFSTAVMLFDYSIPKITPYTPDKDKERLIALRVEQLKVKAALLAYMLNATISPNGEVESLYAFSINVNSERSKYYRELERTYEELEKRESGYEHPEMPSWEGIGGSRALPQTQESQSNQNGGCYVATAVYGSYDCPEVWTLRRYRDDTLAETGYGRAFIRMYYAISPTLVKWFGKTQWFKNIWKPRLDRMVKRLNETGTADTPYKDKNW